MDAACWTRCNSPSSTKSHCLYSFVTVTRIYNRFLRSLLNQYVREYRSRRDLVPTVLPDLEMKVSSWPASIIFYLFNFIQTRKFLRNKFSYIFILKDWKVCICFFLKLSLLVGSTRLLFATQHLAGQLFHESPIHCQVQKTCFYFLKPHVWRRQPSRW